MNTINSNWMAFNLIAKYNDNEEIINRLKVCEWPDNEIDNIIKKVEKIRNFVDNLD